MEQQRRSNGDWYDHERVRKACEFAEMLTVSKSTKSGRTEYIELFPHTRRMIEGIYGWRRADGRRRTRKVFFSTGRKQAKTQSSAIIVCIEFFLSEEAEQEIYFAATDRDQASICFHAVSGMIDRAEELRDLVKITPSSKLIEHTQTGSIMKALSSDGGGKHGYNPSLAIKDEYHAWGPSEAELDAALTTGSKFRREPLWIIPTTAGSDKETLCGEEYAYAKKVASGEIDDPNYLSIIHEVPSDADWTDQSLWPLALPLLETGHHSLEDYQEEFNQALSRPAEQNKFRRLYLNQWTSAATQWIPIKTWDECRGEIDEADYLGLPCWGGLDLGSTGDLTAFSLVWPLEDGRVVVKSWAYVPAATMDDRQKRDGKPYKDWVDHGWMRTTSGNTTDQDEVAAHIIELCAYFNVQGIAADRWRIKYIEKLLEDEQITLFEWGQGYKDMGPAVQNFEDLVFNHRVIHDGNGALRWNMDCCQVQSDPAGNKKLVKPPTHVNSRHIDMAVSVVMAAAAAEVAERSFIAGVKSVA